MSTDVTCAVRAQYARQGRRGGQNGAHRLNQVHSRVRPVTRERSAKRGWSLRPLGAVGSLWSGAVRTCKQGAKVGEVRGGALDNWPPTGPPMVGAGRGGPVGVWEGQSGPSWGCPGSKSGKKGKIAVFQPWSATDPKRGDAGGLEVWGSSQRVRGKVLGVEFASRFACGKVQAGTWAPTRRDLKGC
jgi:hypothetical protein